MVLALNKPAGQAVHTAAGTTSTYFPPSQFTQAVDTVAPVAGWALPAAQMVQSVTTSCNAALLVVDASERYVPVGQAVHDDAPAVGL